MGILGIMNRARGMQVVENVFYVRMMFLLLGLLLSIVNLPIVSGQNDQPAPPGNGRNPINPSPSPASSQDPPLPGQFFPPIPGQFFPPIPGQFFPPIPVGVSPPPASSPPPISFIPVQSPGAHSPGTVETPPPPPPPLSSTQPTGSAKTRGDTWNESEIAGVVIAAIAALLQVAVVAFLLIKRHQMLTTVEYDDIEDLEYDIPPDSNFRDIQSA